jgi:hypothetical protein
VTIKIFISQKDKIIDELESRLKMKDAEYKIQILKLEAQTEKFSYLVKLRDAEIISLNSQLYEINISFEELQNSGNKAQMIIISSLNSIIKLQT